MKKDERNEQLDYYYRVVQSLILSYQDPVSGLFPASPNLNHAWVRDNVYTVLAAWGLSLAYKRPPVLPHAQSNIYLLQQSCVKMMRGLLQCMMRQHDKVEKFKTSHSPIDSLHAKYSANSGTTVVSDHDWGHLQLDATSLYLLILAQMTASGMSIIFNLDEVAFIQNLVFYIESAYCIPDYGIWERGDKANHGLPELNASSIGMAKAALEAMSGLNLFGNEGGPSSVIHVMADDSQKCQAVLQSILPRESSSKEIDSGLLSVISFPAFAVDDIKLIEQTRAAIVTKLQGNYGCKRFLRDGYKTPREDPRRLYYEPNELKMFENIECEWPLFFIYLWIDAIFANDLSTATTYKKALERVLMRAEDGVALVPEMYSVEAVAAAAEAEKPGSQPRHPVGRCPFLWAQSLYIIANLLHQGLLTPEELDPLGRRLCRHGGQAQDVVVQVVVLAESCDIRQQLRTHDMEVQTTDEISPLRVLPARTLSHLHTYLGRNSKLKLTGRRSRDAGILSTSKLYSIQNQLYAFTPQLTDQSRYYVASDSELLIDIFKAEINFLKQSWKNPRGHPLVVVIIKSVYLDNDGKIPMAMITTMKKLKSGYISGTRVCLGRIEDFLDTSCITDLSFLTCLDQGLPQVVKKEVEEYLHEVLDKSGDKKSGIAGLPCRLPRKTSRKISCKGAIKRTRSIVSAYPPDESSRDSFVSDEVLTENESQDDVRPDSQAVVEADSSAMDTTDLPPRHITPTRSRNQSEAQYANTEVEELLVMLRDSKNLEEQGDILQYLIHTHGLHMPTGAVKETGGNSVTLKDLLKEVYVRACCEKRWGLVRHAAGTLGKRVEDLAKTLADLLVRQKQITVGMPPVNELTITGPLPEQELRQLIHEAYGQDESSAMLTQELLVYLAMFIRTEPALFSEMLRLRVGLIIQVMAGELMRTLHCSGEEASEHLLNLSPYEMKNLLHHIISGREFSVSSVGLGNYSIVSFKSARLSRKSDMSTGEIGGLVGGGCEDEAGERGQWLRRRRLDGALNKVPSDFYTRIWHLLDKCEGIVIEGHLLHHNLTKEMTSGELKFALVVESALTCIPQPEYRQLLVESLAVLSLISEYRVVQSIAGMLSASAIVHSANDLFLKHQSTCSGDATLCCAMAQDGGGSASQWREPCGGAAGICQHFYDSAPSGTYGTMTYITKAILKLVDCFPPSGSVDCHIS